MPAEVPFRTFADSAMLAHALAERVADELRQAMAARGRALLVVSGGNTPKHFLSLLSEQPLDWHQVHVTLADERWVGAEDPRSNARMVIETLLQNNATTATFVPLFMPQITVEQAAPRLSRQLLAIGLPIDVLVLGMGNDGHTASLFPGGDQLTAALSPDGNNQLLLPMRAPGAPEPRITLTLPSLASARSVHVHIEGRIKQKILLQAMAEGELPIARVLLAATASVDVYTCND